MDNNLLLEQYSRYKKITLESSPYKCLVNTEIELNPHQINAFCAAINALKTGGIVLADEVGLGKTIEAGLALKYVVNNGAKKILIALPATLRKQWEIELAEKFRMKVAILDRLTLEKDYSHIKKWMLDKSEVSIVLTSYDYASKFIRILPNVKWDLIIVDEAHNLRNVFHGAKRAKKLFELTRGIPKMLLTATPLQNSLSDLYGLISFIDPRIFGDEKVFKRRFIEGQDYAELKNELGPVLYRTLRKDVGKYMNFKKRVCITVDFHLTSEESKLYELVNEFLKRDHLYSIPASNRGLIILVIRKLLASSSFAVIDTFEVLKNRLTKLYQGTKSAKAKEGFDLFWSFIEDEIEEDEIEEDYEEHINIEKQNILAEISVVQEIIDAANKVKSNAKIIALKTALAKSLSEQQKQGITQKVVIFTESKRTQKYIANELRNDGYKESDIVLFNGDYDDPMTKEIYITWQSKNFNNVNHGRGVEYKHAIVDFFRSHAKILVVTDAGSEGLNLQFCNTVINYDLPWNPQKIEQRIGRCHRYGQIHDVVAINLLNTDNSADKRVYDILSKKFELFDGVFGASDVSLGALESGMSFEKTILNIYQNCNSSKDFDKAFNKLNNKLEANVSKYTSQLQNILFIENPNAKGKALDSTKKAIQEYLKESAYWSKFNEPDLDGKTYYWRINNWGEENFGSHGMLFLGAFCDNSKVIFPVLMLCDENGEYIDFEEADLVTAMERANDEDIYSFKPTPDEQKYIKNIYNILTNEMIIHYQKSIEPIISYNKKKIENWEKIQMEQLLFQIEELDLKVEDLLRKEALAKDSLEKFDIRKEISEMQKKSLRVNSDKDKKINEIHKDAKESIEKFEEKLKIDPILLVNIVLKF